MNLNDESLMKVTDTDESEYSPTLTPDKQNFSTITVPPTEGSDAPQFLWNYPINRKDSGHAIDYDLTNVGYHIWLNSNELILFLVGDPHQLVHYNIESGTMSEIDKNVGRCFRLNHNNEVVYVHKAAHNIWYFKTFNVDTDKRSIIGETKTGSEDFEILPDNSIIMGHKSKMYKLSPIGGWKEIDDLQKYGINNISRIAIRNNKIALVHAS